ncbi:hypothetical protein CCH79_00010281 [Gambusia affinis]|uniref:Uncharacterized protein n=1 Tax=Gambusia affinis TaxID=33528 RepID=A0A315VRN9_GAMAF|nr:hypothetical protein CCH79_00010281 [Gambusia affinis]
MAALIVPPVSIHWSTSKTLRPATEHHCVENSLTLLVPVMEERIVPGVKSEIPDEDISVHLTNMISTEMATVLEVPPEVCDQGMELNSLMEQEVSEKVTSIANGIKETSICESITEILGKYSDESGLSNGAGDESEFSLSTDTFEVNEVADGISKTIIDDLHYCKAEGTVAPIGPHCQCAPHFNLKKIVGDIKNLFVSKDKADFAGKEEIVRKPEFSRFASDQFTRMVSSLETSVMDSSETNVVKLKRGAGSPTKLMVPGALSDEERVKLLDHAETDRIPKLDFQSIKPQIERLCAESMENPQLYDKIRQFEIELTEKIYTDIMRSHYDTLPVPPKIPSDSVLSDEKISDISGQTVISPEVFCARIEDEVRRFLQNIFLWIKNEETNRISETDRVSNAISEINNLVEQIYDTSNQLPRAKTPEPCEEKEERRFTAAVPNELIQQRKSDLPLSRDIDFLQNLAELSLIDQFVASDIRNMSIVDAILKVQGPRTEAPEKKMKELEDGMACFVMRTVLSCSEENGGPLKSSDMKKILYYLSGEEIEDITDFAVSKDNENIKHFVQDLYSSLKSQFGSTEDLWKAATMHGGRPFKGAVISYLNSYIQSKPPKGPVRKMSNVRGVVHDACVTMGNVGKLEFLHACSQRVGLLSSLRGGAWKVTCGHVSLEKLRCGWGVRGFNPLLSSVQPYTGRLYLLAAHQKHNAPQSKEVNLAPLTPPHVVTARYESHHLSLALKVGGLRQPAPEEASQGSCLRYAWC